MSTIQLAVIQTSPENPQTCETLAAICGHGIAEMRRGGGIVEIDFPDDWDPDAEDRAILREAIEFGH